MLDPVSALAFEMHAAKGVFALLVGSGISRAAKIPTGWEVTMDLVGQLAALRGSGEVEDLEAWYIQTFGKAPDYSDLLDALATTPAQRQHVIAPYIEPTPEERERGDKAPTAAHRAIAALMARGFVKVVITTNFDRLLELSLAELGVHPTVVSTADHVAGAIPLVHAGPTIVKVHGDYLDTRILNTVSELSGYDEAMNRFLDRVFDEFGLVICGWSGDWDVALRRAIDRTPSRRYPTYWAARGTASAAAQGLIERRAARVVPIASADAFFDELNQKVQALEQLNRPHPLSAELAVAMAKEYLLEPRHAIRLHDLVSAEVSKVLRALDAPQFSVSVWSTEIFARQVEAYAPLMETLLKMGFVAGRWSTLEQATQWVDIVADLSVRGRHKSGPVALIELMAYPATLLLYAFGLGAVVGRRPANLCAMATRIVDYGALGKLTLTDRLNIPSLVQDGGQNRFKAIERYANKKLPGVECVADVLRPFTQTEFRSETAFEEALARLELSLALGYAERIIGTREHFWAPTGRYAFHESITREILDAWRRDYEAKALQCDPCIMANLKAPPRFDDVQSFASHVRWSF